MLILSRHRGEKVLIGEGPGMVTVVVMEIRAGKVRLGIVADEKTLVDRSEVRDARDREKILAGLRSRV